MRTLATNTLPAGVRRPPPRKRRFFRAITALLVAATAITATALIMWQRSTSHSNPTLTRVVGPDTFVGSVYDEQVTSAGNPRRAGSVSDRQVVPTARTSPQAGNAVHTQQPPYLPMGDTETDSNSPQAGNVVHTQQPPYLPVGNTEPDVRGLDDDSAALTAALQEAQRPR